MKAVEKSCRNLDFRLPRLVAGQRFLTTRGLHAGGSFFVRRSRNIFTGKREQTFHWAGEQELACAGHVHSLSDREVQYGGKR